MSSPIISVKNIGKKYKLGATLGGRNYKTLRDVLTQVAFGPIRKLSAAFRKKPSISGSHSSINNPITKSPNNSITKSPNNPITKSPNNPKEFWALKDISFDVQRGEVVGIIGRNGAGKSTLLKILSEITEPTEGEIRIRGRVASLLEVGTGFHPELSGRENVYMNGAILGMTRSEIKAKFDEIVAFAEVEKFVDTPVKRYSSGMYVRLAFAVAAYLEPDILLVDEVLAVGDVGFQKKCLGKMETVATEGRTVLFVSHNMAAIEKLCPRVCVIEQGSLVFDGESKNALDKYFELMTATVEVPLDERTDRTGTGIIRIKAFSILNSKDIAVDSVRSGENCTFRFAYDSKAERVKDIDFSFTVRNLAHQALFRCRTTESGLKIPQPFPSKGFFCCHFRKMPLAGGTYVFGFRLLVNGMESDYILGGYGAKFNVVQGDFYGTGKVTDFTHMFVEHDWQVTSKTTSPTNKI